MKIHYKNWRIKSHNLGGFMVQKKIGAQWKETTYHSSLSQAAAYLFERHGHDGLADVQINIADPEKASVALQLLATKLQILKEEIIEACK